MVQEVGLSLSPSKTVIVPFTNRYKLGTKAQTECRIEASNEANLASKLMSKTQLISAPQHLSRVETLLAQGTGLPKVTRERKTSVLLGTATRT